MITIRRAAVAVGAFKVAIARGATLDYAKRFAGWFLRMWSERGTKNQLRNMVRRGREEGESVAHWYARETYGFYHSSNWGRSAETHKANESGFRLAARFWVADQAKAFGLQATTPWEIVCDYVRDLGDEETANLIDLLSR